MSIELLHIDCMEYMKGCEDNAFDLAIVDPPYGGDDAIGVKNGRSHNAQRGDYKLFENKEPDAEYWDQLFRVSKKQIVWGANFYKNINLPGGMICWNKNGTAFGEAELAWYSDSQSVKMYEYTWNGMIQGDMRFKEHRQHPTQKPVKLYDWLLTNYAEPGQKILDTHLGSGSSAIAAHYFGCDFVGCEIDEDYYKAACERFDHETRQIALL